MSYPVYTTEEIGERNHIAIYIETVPDAAPQAIRGRLYHVVGTILMGMTYAPRDTPDPETIPGHVPGSKKKIATIAKDDLIRFEQECCEVVPPPTAQVTISGKRLDPSKPLYRCGGWIEDVKKMAFEKGIFKDEK
ncbi:uncharacterized protein BO80DRAFT_423137 [Aspergillus ibericus CBS 121593]|uniref:Uncharacterized protein n=1 Tax=Aspergillus ibericus CBS 121593 TaxID=1448316 RepID=A0A395H7N2_9EURO|nr:hypothetical protein BO80DRAFT_423137 [Aspergillus ibericus CBS 121593]RAL03165.1 hypothetical protein BO80DRAFT_423137 [Aspergillus ibericus CBS 121593]